jgi:hypothetical protein
MKRLMQQALTAMLCIAPLTLSVQSVQAQTVAPGWETVQALPAGSNVQVVSVASGKFKGALITATADSLMLRDGSGDRSIARAEVRELKVRDQSRRIRRGIITTLIGLGAGAAAGWAACVYCANEGHDMLTLPGAAGGAAIGAVGFAFPGYRTVYKVARR